MVSYDTAKPARRAGTASLPWAHSPLENTPHKAGAIADVRVLAVVAPFDSTAHHRGAAGLDGLHQAMLMQGQRVRLPVGGAVLSKDVGQLQRWPWAHFLERLVAAAGLAGWSSLSKGLTVAATTCGDTAV